MVSFQVEFAVAFKDETISDWDELNTECDLSQEAGRMFKDKH